MTRHPILIRLVPVALILGLALAAVASMTQSPIASAHAKLESSVPAANSTVTQAPSVVTLHFAEDLNPASSDVTMYDIAGKVVSTGKAQVDTNDPKTMTVQMTGNDSESYLVVWHNVSLDDGDPAIGSFTFNVGQHASQPTATPSDAGGTGAGNTAGSAQGMPGWVAALAGILGLVVGGAVGFIVARRR